jgi:TfoX/Sxy family transcriptional regulator of competence genes
VAYDEGMAERVRSVLAARRDVVEKKMMGGICFMVNGSMCCGVSASSLMVRVGRDAYPRMLAEPHVRPLEFAGRRPAGFVLVDRAGCRTDAALATWIRRGVEFVSTLPAKAPAPPSVRPRARRP